MSSHEQYFPHSMITTLNDWTDKFIHDAARFYLCIKRRNLIGATQTWARLKKLQSYNKFYKSFQRGEFFHRDLDLIEKQVKRFTHDTSVGIYQVNAKDLISTLNQKTNFETTEYYEECMRPPNNVRDKCTTLPQNLSNPYII